MQMPPFLSRSLFALSFFSNPRFAKNGIVERRKRQTEAMFRELRVHIPPSIPLPPSTQLNSTYYW
jgi:hypothetical protein